MTEKIDETIFCVDDFERLAKAGISEDSFKEYIFGSAGEGECHERNLEALKK